MALADPQLPAGVDYLLEGSTATGASPDLHPPLSMVDEVADALGVSRWQVYRAAAAGRIPSVRLGRSVRFELGAVLAALRRGSAPERPAVSTDTLRARRPDSLRRRVHAAVEPRRGAPERSPEDRRRAALAATAGLRR